MFPGVVDTTVAFSRSPSNSRRSFIGPFRFCQILFTSERGTDTPAREDGCTQRGRED